MSVPSQRPKDEPAAGSGQKAGDKHEAGEAHEDEHRAGVEAAAATSDTSKRVIVFDGEEFHLSPAMTEGRPPHLPFKALEVTAIQLRQHSCLMSMCSHTP